jgi:uncharacterized protein (DUF1800 family)
MKLTTAAIVLSTGLGAVLAARAATPSAATLPSDEKTIVHVLNRIGFGARPGDVEHVRQVGLQKYIEQQLHPERLDDPGMDARLADLRTIGLSSRLISKQFEQPLLELRRERQQTANNRKQQTASNGNQETANNGDPGTARDRQPPDPAQQQAQQQANSVLIELDEQKLLRAIYSNRQLQEALTDFWFNHFNVDARKGRDRFLLTEYERETIRPNVLGKFRDLLEATARSPAMLFYLDNWLSADPSGPHPPSRRPGFTGPGGGRFAASMPMPRPANNARKGLNENYARELMELHTLGVDGGYTQKDVTEVARAFTGWTMENPRQGGAFRFEPRIHDEGSKIVLGHRIKSGGGVRDGEQVLDILAAHPSTAHFIATKLARRFVSDTPPPALVDRLAARFRETGGDLRVVMMALLTSPEFLAPEAYRAKVKTPFEFVVSAVRATGDQIADVRPLVRSLQDLGMPLYQCQPPTGYKDTADAWANTGALVSRMNFALALASGRLPALPGGRQLAGGGAQPGPSSVAQDFSAAHAVDGWVASVEAALAHDVSDTTRTTIAKATAAPERAALALGSPEFQRR